MQNNQVGMSDKQRPRLTSLKKGTVKFFDQQKGFGFIQTENGEDIFVHANGVREAIRDGDKVLFETEEGRKGLHAINVKLDK